jgi:hypothetical protein
MGCLGRSYPCQHLWNDRECSSCVLAIELRFNSHENITFPIEDQDPCCSITSATTSLEECSEYLAKGLNGYVVLSCNVMLSYI